MTAREHRRACKLVLRDKDLTSAARLLWCVIETFADRNGTRAFPSLETLAAVCGHKTDWVCRYRSELRRQGLLLWASGIKPDGTRQPCCYTVLYPGIPDPIHTPQNGARCPYPPKRGNTGESLVLTQNGKNDALAHSRNNWRRPRA